MKSAAGGGHLKIIAMTIRSRCTEVLAGSCATLDTSSRTVSQDSDDEGDHDDQDTCMVLGRPTLAKAAARLPVHLAKIRKCYTARSKNEQDERPCSVLRTKVEIRPDSGNCCEPVLRFDAAYADLNKRY